MDRLDELAGKLFDFAVLHPEGFTNEEALAELGLKHITTLNRVIRRLRLILGTDEINLVCDPQGQRERWLYRLIGTIDLGSPWIRNRLRDLEARLETQHSVARSLVNATDGRSIEGRKARLCAKTLGRLREDLAEYDDQQLTVS